MEYGFTWLRAYYFKVYCGGEMLEGLLDTEEWVLCELSNDFINAQHGEAFVFVRFASIYDENLDWDSPRKLLGFRDA